MYHPEVVKLPSYNDSLGPGTLYTPTMAAPSPVALPSQVIPPSVLPSAVPVALPVALPQPPKPVAAAVQRRKRTHSETERRRREKVNARFNELRELVPACRHTQFARRGGEVGLHKLDILTEAVRYVRDLERQLALARKGNIAKINFLVN